MGAAARLNRQKVGAQARELAAHRGAGALTEGDNGNDRGDADDDAQRRQNAAALVGAQRGQRGRNGLEDAQVVGARLRHLGQQGKRVIC